MAADTRCCSMPGCITAVVARGLCMRHYLRWRRHGDPAITLIEQAPHTDSSAFRACSVRDCDAPVFRHALCVLHYGRWRRHGSPSIVVPRGPKPKPRICSVPGCGKPARVRGWCQPHYMRWYTHGDPEIVLPRGRPHKPCSVQGCGAPARSRGWCQRHYMRWRRYGDPEIAPAEPKPKLSKPKQKPKSRTCSVRGCGAPVLARGWCRAHYQRWHRHGDPTVLARSAVRTGCRVKGCKQPHFCQGWCRQHYSNWRYYGDPEITHPKGGPVKLTAAQVRAIRVSTRPVAVLTRRYQVSNGTIYRIQNGATWRTV